MSYSSMSEVRTVNRKAGNHWFDADTMRFFGTVIESELIDGRYFITSEQPPYGPRAYSIREANEDGSISTVGEFTGHKTATRARLALMSELEARR